MNHLEIQPLQMSFSSVWSREFYICILRLNPCKNWPFIYLSSTSTAITVKWNFGNAIISNNNARYQCDKEIQNDWYKKLGINYFQIIIQKFVQLLYEFCIKLRFWKNKIMHDILPNDHVTAWMNGHDLEHDATVLEKWEYFFSHTLQSVTILFTYKFIW